MKPFVRIGLLVAATLILASGPAWAKGDDPVSVRIQGPGLVHPVMIRGDMGAPLGDPYWALAHLALGGPGMSAPTPSALGPRYTFIYVDSCCGNRVVQYVYPFAADGPVVFTPAGQRSAAFQMSFTDEFPSFSAGWSRAPSSTLTGTLVGYGIPRPAAGPSTGSSDGGTKAVLWLLVALLAAGLAAGMTFRGGRRRSRLAQAA